MSSAAPESDPEPLEASSEPFAPVRKPRRALAFAAQNRVRGALGWPTQLRGGDRAHAASEPHLLEYGLGEGRPRAVTFRSEVPQTPRQLEQLPDGGGEMADVGRAAALVGDDLHLVALRAQPQHRANEVRARRAEEPGGSDDPGVIACGALGLKLRPAVGGERVRRV